MIAQNSKRPARTYSTDRLTRLLRVVTWVLAPLHVVIMLPGALSGTDEVPLHWNFDGTVTRYGSAWEILIVSVVFAVLVAGILLLSLKPQWLNHATIVTETNAQEVYREGERLMIWLAFVMAGMQGAVAWTFALGLNDPFAIIVPLLVLLFVVLGVGIARQMRL